MISLLSAQFLSSQVVHPELMTPLPDILIESSGIETISSNDIWTHNDSGDLPRIFKIDTSGNLLRILNFSGVTATDIEDVAQDENGTFYLGDFGNNLNDRTDLRIYKIPNPDSISADSVTPEIIWFNFPDQLSFPPGEADKNFDCEAMFHYRDSLYLFSKNRGTSSFSKMYRLPDMPGTYTAELIDSFNTITWITSADINAAGNAMVLLSYDRIWLFTNFRGSDFFDGNATMLYTDTAWREGIVFVNETKVYLTDEKFMGIGGNLYSLELKDYIVGLPDLNKVNNAIELLPNPAHDEVTIQMRAGGPSLLKFSLYDLNGVEMAQKKFCLASGINSIKVPLKGLQPGAYIARILLDDKQLFTRKIILQ